MKKLMFRALTVIAFGVMFAFATAQVQAATEESVTNSPSTVKISPVRTDVTILPGKTGTVQIVVTNLTKEPITVRPIQNDFIAGDDRGTPALILDENQFAPTHSLKRFMKPMETVTIPADSNKEVTLTIAVPEDTKAGGFYGAVRFEPVAAEGSKQVNLNASAASLVLLTVPGELIEQLAIETFDITQKGDKVGGLINNPDNLNLAFKFKNEGNVQVAPFGQVYVKQGDKVIYSSKFNLDEPRSSILPDSSRRWEVPLEKLGTFGQYTVGATFTYGTTNKSFEMTRTFWIIPMAYIIGAIAAVVLLIAGAVFFWLRLRRNKSRRTMAYGKRRL